MYYYMLTYLLLVYYCQMHAFNVISSVDAYLGKIGLVQLSLIFAF